MTQTRFTVLDAAQRHPDLAEQIARTCHQIAPTVKETTDFPRPADLGGTSRMDCITSTVLDPLFALTQQAVRFRSGTEPWASLPGYDVDGFSSFTTPGAA